MDVVAAQLPMKNTSSRASLLRISLCQEGLDPLRHRSNLASQAIQVFLRQNAWHALPTVMSPEASPRYRAQVGTQLAAPKTKYGSTRATLAVAFSSTMGMSMSALAAAMVCQEATNSSEGTRSAKRGNANPSDVRCFKERNQLAEPENSTQPHRANVFCSDRWSYDSWFSMNPGYPVISNS
jgi:hypothetical protein